MCAIEPIFPSDAPCPGIDGLVLPARDRIISLASGWAGEAFDLLKAGVIRQESAKQLKVRPAGSWRILSIVQTAVRPMDGGSLA